MARVPISPIPIYGKQAEFRRSPAWARGFVAGRGSGKTKIGAIDVFLTARSGEPWMAVSPSYNVMWETTWQVSLEVAEQLSCLVSAVRTPVPKIRFRTQDGGEATLVFRSGEDPDRLRGPSKAGLWLDEASIMHEDVFRFGIPVLRHRGKMGRLTLTFTPRGKKHWTFGTFYRKTQIQPNNRQLNLIEELKIQGGDGASALEDFEIIGGVLYRKRPKTRLIRAHTLENPFLPPEFYHLIRQQYSSSLAAQELAGEFVDFEGLLFQRHFFDYVDEAPYLARRVRYWDRAATPGGGSFTAGVLVAMSESKLIYIEDVVRGQWSPGERNKIIMETAHRDARKYQNTVEIWTEQEGGSSGTEISNQLVKMLVGFPAFADIVTGKRNRIVEKTHLPGEAKINRALPLAAQAEAGNVFIVRGGWNETFMDEVTAFPEWSHSDQVDGASGAFNKLADAFSGYDPKDVKDLKVAADASRYGFSEDFMERSQLLSTVARMKSIYRGSRR